ncbi:MAG: sigma-E factor negative regulatory protein [Pseudoxanthomonas suwonensis]|nr:sigma-E factor negative regulatory protein [Pseudoxanthomonas suwonensis]
MSTTSDILIDPAGPTPDRMELHHRQQLSAMADGALAPDQARFLLRRLQHDHELAAHWERWQVYGDAMRGHAHALLPTDFAERVARALHDTPEAVQALAGAAPRRGHALRWAGGGALAASVALVALFGLRPAPQGGPADAAPLARSAAAAPVAGSDAGTGATVLVEAEPAAVAASRHAGETARDVGVATAALAAPAALATASSVRERDVPRSSAGADRPVARRVAAAAVTGEPSAPVSQPVPLVAPADTAERAPRLAGQTPQVSDPFRAPAAASPRPWPRAVLPGLQPGAFNASFGGQPFAPVQPLLRAHPAAPGAESAMEPAAELSSKDGLPPR